MTTNDIYFIKYFNRPQSGLHTTQANSTKYLKLSRFNSIDPKAKSLPRTTIHIIAATCVLLNYTPIT